MPTKADLAARIAELEKDLDRYRSHAQYVHQERKP